MLVPFYTNTEHNAVQDSLLRSLLKGVVWRVFSTALTVSIILAVFHDTVQVSCLCCQMSSASQKQISLYLKRITTYHVTMWLVAGTAGGTGPSDWWS